MIKIRSYSEFNSESELDSNDICNKIYFINSISAQNINFRS